MERNFDSIVYPPYNVRANRAAAEGWSAQLNVQLSRERNKGSMVQDAALLCLHGSARVPCADFAGRSSQLQLRHAESSIAPVLFTKVFEQCREEIHQEYRSSTNVVALLHDGNGCSFVRMLLLLRSVPRGGEWSDNDVA